MIADSFRYTDQVGAIVALLAVTLVLAIIDRIGR